MKSLKKASYSAFGVLLISRKPPRAVLMDSGDKFCPLSEGLSNCRLWGNRACSSEEGCVQAGLREDEVRILSPDQCLAGSPFGGRWGHSEPDESPAHPTAQDIWIFSASV